MAGIESFDDLLQQLETHPEWRQRLRGVVLTDELTSLPAHVTELAAAQVRTEQAVERLAQHVDALTQDVDALTQRVDALTQRVDALTQRVDALTQRVDALTQRVDALTQRVDALTQHVAALAQHVAALAEQVGILTVRLEGLAEQLSVVATRTDRTIGFLVEQQYRQKAHAYFQTIASRIRVLSPEQLDRLIEPAVQQQTFSAREAMEVRWADAIMSARKDEGDVLLVLEASSLVEDMDVRRAAHRAGILSLLGTPAIGIAAGDKIAPDAAALARQLRVWLVINGHVEPPPAA